MRGQNNWFDIRWFDIREIDTGIFLIREPGHVQSYLIKGDKKAALIDTGMGFCDLTPLIEKLTDLPLAVFNTHWHFDHIGGNREFKRTGISYVQSCLDQKIPLPENFEPGHYAIQSPVPSFLIKHGDVFDLGGRTLEAIATPGHTHGSMSFLDSRAKALFCGDLLYDGTLYAHFTDSDLNAYIRSLETVDRMAAVISSIYGAHNTPRLDKSIAGQVLRVMVRIRTRSIQGCRVYDWGTPVDFFSRDGIDILVKQPGTDGVRLF